MPTFTELLARRCCSQTGPLDAQQVTAYLAAVPGWQTNGSRISNIYEFKNYYRTLAFVNAIAYIFHAEDHHPDLLVSYKRCEVSFYTHSVKGLSENDFICAAKVEAVYQQGSEAA